MTFILGLNLSDRIYLAADSLATRMPDGKREIAGYCLKLIQMTPADFSTSISCLFAGNKNFINYVFGRIDKALEEKVLSTDINELIGQVDAFMKKIVPEYPGKIEHERCKIIFAGCSNVPGSVKRFKLDNLSKALGTDAGHITDANAVQGMQFGFVSVPDQKIFSYIIDVKTNQIEVGEIGEMYSMIYGGSRFLKDEEKQLVLKHFLSKRNFEEEAKDIVHFLKNQFNDTIGGAITLGYIDSRKRLIYTGYDIDRTKKHPNNWSFTIKDGPSGSSDPKDGTGFIATDPDGKEHDLGKGFYFLADDHQNSLEL